MEQKNTKHRVELYRSELYPSGPYLHKVANIFNFKIFDKVLKCSWSKFFLCYQSWNWNPNNWGKIWACECWSWSFSGKQRFTFCIEFLHQYNRGNLLLLWKVDVMMNVYFFLIGNLFQGFLNLLHVLPNRRKPFTILHDVSGSIKPGR